MTARKAIFYPIESSSNDPRQVQIQLDRQSQLQLQTTQFRDPKLHALARMDDEMQQILNNKAMDASYKFIQYNALMRRYGTIPRQVDGTAYNESRKCQADDVDSDPIAPRLYPIVHYQPTM